MSVCKTATRRRRQAANGYRHLPKNKRPHYTRAVSSAVKLASSQKQKSMVSKGSK